MSKAPRTNDIDLRILVVDALLSKGIPRDAIRHEITLDSASSDGRADIVVALDRELIGIEIKSGKDTLTRLDSQREQYGCRFDSMCLALDARHIPATDQTWEVSNWLHRLRFGAIAVVGPREGGGIEFVDSAGWCARGLPWEARASWAKSYGATDRQAPNAMLSMLWAAEVLDIAATLVSSGSVPACNGGQRCRLIPPPCRTCHH